MDKFEISEFTESVLSDRDRVLSGFDAEKAFRIMAATGHRWYMPGLPNMETPSPTEIRHRAWILVEMALTTESMALHGRSVVSTGGIRVEADAGRSSVSIEYVPVGCEVRIEKRKKENPRNGQ